MLAELLKEVFFELAKNAERIADVVLHISRVVFIHIRLLTGSPPSLNLRFQRRNQQTLCRHVKIQTALSFFKRG